MTREEVELATAYDRMLTAFRTAFDMELAAMPAYLPFQDKLDSVYRIVSYYVHESELGDTMDSSVSSEWHKWKEEKLQEVGDEGKGSN